VGDQGRGRSFTVSWSWGLISQDDWNEGFGELLGSPAGNLMGRLLADLEPAYDGLRMVRLARTVGVRTAVLSNSLGRAPHDPYARYRLPAFFDVVVLSAEVGLRKPDPAIFQLTVERLSVPAASCVFADDTEGEPGAGHGHGDDGDPCAR
jgi:putative hydrolase of the HAD superfamily